MGILLSPRYRHPTLKTKTVRVNIIINTYYVIEREKKRRCEDGEILVARWWMQWRQWRRLPQQNIVYIILYYNNNNNINNDDDDDNNKTTHNRR